MIRKPIGRPLQIALGIASFCALIASYTWLADGQYRTNPTQMTTPGWTKSQQVGVIEESMATATAALKSATASGDAVAIKAAQSRVSKLESAMKQVEDDNHKSILKGLRKITTADGDDNSWLWDDFGISLKRFVLGVLLGVTLAFFSGIAMGCFTPIEAFLKPPLAFLASIPPTAMMVVYMLIFKLKPELFVAVIGIGIFPVLAQAIFQAVKNDVPETSVNKAYTLGASNFEVIWEVIVPQILPRIIDAIRLQIGPAMIFLIAVELIAGSEGIGYRLRIAPRGSHYNVIYIYLIFLGVFGMMVDWGLSSFRRWMCPWYESKTS